MILPTPNYDSTTLLVIGFLTVFSIFFFLAVFIFYLAVKNEKMKKDAKARDEAYKKAVVMIEEAKTKSLNLLKESSDRARKIIKDADLVVDDSKKIVETRIEDATNVMRQDVLKEVDQFSQDLHKEVLQSEEDMKKRLSEEYETARKDLEAYKKRKIEEMDREILDIISKTATEVLGKTMTPEDHLDLIRQILKNNLKPFELTEKF